MAERLSEIKLQNLLRSVSVVVEKNNQISKLKQESFNIFSILRKDHEEEKLHSAFIAELLDIQGSHEMGDTFLQLFLQKLNLETSVLSDDIRVTKEKSVRQGRIDILIEGEDFIIAVENKIYARDQNQQLKRYREFVDMGTGKSGYVIYLTLDGHLADTVSSCGVEYLCASYRFHILEWLEDCIRHAVGHPTLRETIRQYITLLRKLTHQLTREQEKEMIAIIRENYEAAEYVYNNFANAQHEAVMEFMNNIMADLKKEYPEDEGWKIDLSRNLREKWSGLTITNPQKWPWDLHCCFAGHPTIMWHCSIWGFNHVMDADLFRKTLEGSMTKIQNEYGPFSQSSVWAYYQFIYNSPEERKRIITGEESHKVMVQKLSTLINETATDISRVRDSVISNKSEQ